MSNAPPPTRDQKPKITAGWLTAAPTQAVFRALQNQGHDVRVVGGAPRNTLASIAVTDIDMATTATPEETMSAAAAADLKCVPTGLAHGTVTMISDGQPFEVTTLREDVATDGRRATVAFTDDWVRDAERRDFTINALYVNADGSIFDPVGGLVDLDQGRVRFIGDPVARIREDYLRILRFFRFASQFASGEPDVAALSACKTEREGLATLSAERVRSELLRILVTPRAGEMFQAIASADLFAQLLTMPVRIDHLIHLIAIEDAQSLTPDALRRLAALAVRDDQDATAISRELRLSNEERARLLAIGRHRAIPPQHAARSKLEARLYQIGREAYRDTELLTWARSGDDPTCDWRFQRYELPESWQSPQMPVSGADVLALGVSSGPRIGQVLSDFEDWWIAAGFPEDETMVNAKLRDLIHKDD